MMAEAIDSDTLRDMAAHRGLKLLKSRRRKAGTGDFGKFGLTDADGTPLLGIGKDGLTASAQEIEQYLRQGAVSNWKASADATPPRAASKTTQKREDADEQDEEPAIRRRPNRARSSPSVQMAKSKAGAPPVDKAADKPVEKTRATSKRKVQRGEGGERAAATESAETRARAEPEPELLIRPGRSADAAALAPLLSQLVRVDIDELAIARNLEAARKAKGGMVVAQWGDIVGFCGWAVIPTVQHGAIGRITLLLVDEAYRRRGIATALLDAAMVALGKAGCTRFEAMSDIEIANAHGFFRSLKFTQTSYRFARDIDKAD